MPATQPLSLAQIAQQQQRVDPRSLQLMLSRANSGGDEARAGRILEILGRRQFEQDVLARQRPQKQMGMLERLMGLNPFGVVADELGPR